MSDQTSRGNASVPSGRSRKVQEGLGGSKSSTHLCKDSVQHLGRHGRQVGDRQHVLQGRVDLMGLNEACTQQRHTQMTVN